MPAVGAPIGNNNPAKGKLWSNAIQRAVAVYPERVVSLEVNRGVDNAAYEFVHKMMNDGDLGFFKEFGDRLDGKAAQTVDTNLNAAGSLLDVLTGLSKKQDS